MKKRLLSILLVLTMVLTLVPAVALTAGAEGEWYTDGNGDEATPYIISTYDGLNAFAEYVNADSANSMNGKYIKLADDFGQGTGTNTALTTQIGSSNSFKGTFDGNGKEVALNISTDANYVGMFGYVNGGTVKNVTVSGSVTATAESAYVGGVAGLIEGSGIVTNCCATCTVTDAESSASVGGVVGYNGGGSVTNCSASGNVTGSGIGSGVGGVVGYNRDSVTNCCATGSVTVGGSSNAGGVVGYNEGGNVTNCYATGSVTVGSCTAAGGVAGNNASEGTVTNCFYKDGIADMGVGEVETDIDANTLKMADANMKGAATSEDSLVYKLNNYLSTTSVPGAKLWKVATGVNGGYPTLMDVDYIDASGATKTCTQYTVVNSTMTGTWTSGWYVVNDYVVMTGAQVTVSGDVHLILCDGASLTVTGANGKAGICVSGTDNSLAIYGQTNGTGLLTATGSNAQGSSGSAGIGGNDDCNGGAVTVNGGRVTATGGNDAAGIGGSVHGNGGAVTVNGGTVTAIGFSRGAGIGGGAYGDGGSVTVNGGTVTATGGNNGKGIGCGLDGGGNGTLTVASGMVIKAGANEAGAVEKSFTPAENCVSVLSGAKYVTVELGLPTSVTYQKPVYNTANEPESGLLKFEEDTVTDFIIVTKDTTTFEDGKWYVVATDVTIGTEEERSQITVTGAANLILMDGKTLTVEWPDEDRAAISVAKGKSLTIYGQTNGTGTLVASGTTSGYGAAIGGDATNGVHAGKITINGGIVNADGKNGGAGIGGTYKSTWVIDHNVYDNGDGGDVVINGGSVNARTSAGDASAAGIGGGGYGGNGGKVVINGGTVVAFGYGNAAGIGGAYNGGHSDAEHELLDGGNCGTIIINDGFVAAFGEGDSVGIGTGGFNRGSDPGSIAINGGFVYSVGIASSAGIGGSCNGNAPKITITGGTVIALGGQNGAGIGSGQGCSGADITISGGTITAIGGTGGSGCSSGIGGAYGATSNGTLTVTSGSGLSVRAGTNTGAGAVKCDNASDVFGKRCVRVYTAKATSVPFIYWDEAQNKMVQGSTDDYDILTADTDTVSYGFYVVNDNVTYGADKNLKIDGDSHLIIADGKTLTVNTPAEGKSAIEVNYGKSLTVYAQSEGTGTGALTVKGADGADGGGAGIGGSGGGTVVINGGNITAAGGSGTEGNAGQSGGAGIGGRSEASEMDIIINGGTVKADGGAGAAGIGGGYSGYDIRITVNGGKIDATGGNAGGAGLGSGKEGTDGLIKVNGGEINAVAGTDASGIKIGAMTVNGGFVNATGDESKQGISLATISVAEGSNISESSDGTAWAEVENDADLATNLDGRYAKIDARIIFDDGFGKTDCEFTTYTKGTSYAVGSGTYKFAGWFDGATELTTAASAVCGTTYTAKWTTASGKTIVTKLLNLDWQTPISDSGISWDNSTHTLTLDGAVVDVKGEDVRALLLPDEACKIVLAEGSVNSVSLHCTKKDAKDVYAIDALNNLEISGKGTLNVTATAADDVTNASCAAIMSKGNQTYTDATVVATAKDYAIFAESDITIKSGSVTANAASGVTTDSTQYAICANEGDITIEGGTVTTTGGSHGIVAGRTTTSGNLIIKGGTVNATAVTSALWAKDSVEIYGGTVNATATGTDRVGKDYGINSQDGSVKIYGGNVTAYGKGYGIRAKNGNIRIYDGAKLAPAGSGELSPKSAPVEAVGGNPVVIAKGDTAAYFVGTEYSLRVPVGFIVKANASKDNDGEDITAAVEEDGTVKGTADAKYIKIYNNTCVYTADVKAGEEAQLLIVNGKEAGEFIISGDSKNGFTLKNAGGEYLALVNGEVKTQTEKFTWKYDGGLYTETKTTTRSGFWFWSFTTTKVTKTYLTFGDSAFGTSSSKVSALVQVVADEHDYKWTDNHDGTHTGKCKHCNDEVTEDHDFVAGKCTKCGALDETVCKVTKVKVTEKKVTSYSGFWFFMRKVTKFQYTLEPEVNGVTATKVEYSGDRSVWNTGRVFTSDAQVTHFYIRVTDSLGHETVWEWNGGEYATEVTPG